MAGINTKYKSTLPTVSTKKGTLTSYKGGYTGDELLNQYNTNRSNFVGSTKKSGKVTDKVSKAPTALQSYDTSSSSGGSGGSSFSASSLLDNLRNANQLAYDAEVAAAKTANEQTLKNLSDAYNRYREDYTTNKANLESQYNTTANNLLKSLQRYQEQNAADVKNQRQSFLTNQSALETARAEADRQLRIDAARRGLGGSGLQQLAQLQTLLSQGQDISELATSNQDSMDKLRKALTQEMQDYNDDLKEAQEIRDKGIASLDTELKRKGEDYATAQENANTNLRDLLAKYAAELANANANAYSTSFSASRSGSGSGSEDANIITGLLQASELDLSDQINNLASMSDKALKSAYNKGTKSTVANLGTTDRNEIAKYYYNQAISDTRNAQRNYGSKYNNLYTTNESNLKTILRNKGYNV